GDQMRRTRIARDSLAARRRELREYRAAQQKFAQLRRHLLENLGGEVVEHMAIDLARLARRGAGPGVERESQPGGPTARAVQQLGGVGAAAGCRDECRNLVAFEAQILLS